MPNQSAEGITIRASIQNHPQMPVNLTSQPWTDAWMDLAKVGETANMLNTSAAFSQVEELSSLNAR